jgi:hypothetical protein
VANKFQNTDSSASYNANYTSSSQVQAATAAAASFQYSPMQTQNTQNSTTQHHIQQSSQLQQQQQQVSTSSSSIPNKNLSIFLPGDKKPKMISAKKPEIRADVVCSTKIDFI